jgi:imidazoleglycerol-phosphate dehydratase
MRTATIERKTNETDIRARVNLDGTGIFQSAFEAREEKHAHLASGTGFFAHMLLQVARHGFIDIELNVTGDFEVDHHHAIEDTGIVLGKAFAQALGDKAGIRRYGHAYVPMDDALALCVADFSARPYLRFEAAFTAERIGGMETETLREFFHAFCTHAGLTLHIKLIHGDNNHHIAEAIFKAFGRAISEAVTRDARVMGALSTKGSFDA